MSKVDRTLQDFDKTLKMLMEAWSLASSTTSQSFYNSWSFNQIPEIYHRKCWKVNQTKKKPLATAALVYGIICIEK